MIEGAELSNKEALLCELEKLKKGSDSAKLDAILETLFKLLLLMLSTNPTPTSPQAPAPRLLG